MSTPHLHDIAAFETALQNYHVSPAADQVLQSTPFAVMLAPTSAGRNTIITELVKTGEYYFIISDTTRPPRVNNGLLEKNGVEYFFRTEPEMLQEIQNGMFVEAELIHRQQVSGTSIRELQKAQDQHKIAITDVDLGGSLKIAELKADATILCVLPPSFEEWMRRIVDRSQPKPEEVQRRLQTAIVIFNTVLQNDRYIFVVNDKLEDAVASADAIIRHHRIDPDEQQRARAIAAELSHKTQEYLDSLDI